MSASVSRSKTANDAKAKQDLTKFMKNDYNPTESGVSASGITNTVGRGRKTDDDSSDDDGYSESVMTSGQVTQADLMRKLTEKYLNK